MKKLFALLLAALTLLSLVACGAGGDKGGDTANGTSAVASNGGADTEAQTDGGNVGVLLPEGWDENQYGMYISGVWDSDFLPDVMPEEIEGVKVDQTTFKDYTHDEMSQNYSVGPIWYESYDEYRVYGVGFYATIAQYDEFIAVAEAKGFKGGESTNREEDSWWEAIYYNESGWFMYITFKTSTYESGYDGFVSVSLSDSVFEKPESVSGNPLPTEGLPAYDYSLGAYMLDELNDEVTFDLENDTFPTDHHYAIFFDYYGTDADYAADYASVLVGEGWTVIQEDSSEDYYVLLEKDGQYAQVDYIPYDGILQIGFASMIENLQY